MCKLLKIKDCCFLCLNTNQYVCPKSWTPPILLSRSVLFQPFQIVSLSESLTCFGVDREEILRVASTDAITQSAGRGGKVRVLRLDTDD